MALEKHVLPSIDHEANNAEDHMTNSEAVVLVRYVDKILAESGRHRNKYDMIMLIICMPLKVYIKVYINIHISMTIQSL